MYSEKAMYSAPRCEVLDLRPEGVIADSPKYNTWDDFPWDE